MVTDDAVTIEGVKTHHLRAMNWLAEYFPVEADGSEYRFRVARPAAKPQLSARFPRR